MRLLTNFLEKCGIVVEMIGIVGFEFDNFEMDFLSSCIGAKIRVHGGQVRESVGIVSFQFQ